MLLKCVFVCVCSCDPLSQGRAGRGLSADVPSGLGLQDRAGPPEQSQAAVPGGPQEEPQDLSHLEDKWIHLLFHWSSLTGLIIPQKERSQRMCPGNGVFSHVFTAPC